MLFDITIIGSGISGIAVADRLRNSKAKILIVCGKNQGSLKHQYHGKQPNLEITHYNGIGGGFNVWGRFCRPLDKNDYLLEKCIEAYPTRKYYAAACSFLGIEAIAPYWFNKNKQAVRVNEGLQHNYYIQSDYVDIENILSNYKPLSDLNIVSSGKSESKFKLTNTNVLLVNKTDEGFIVELENDDFKHIKSRRVVLACGAVGSVDLAFRSFGADAVGLNEPAENGEVKVPFIDHTTATIGRVSLAKIRSDLGRRLQRKVVKIGITTPSLGNNNVYLLPAFGKSDVVDAELIRSKLVASRDSLKAFILNIKFFIKNPSICAQLLFWYFGLNFKNRKYDLWMVGEQKFSEDKYILLGKGAPKLYWNVNDWDINNAKSFYENLLSELQPLSSSSFNSKNYQKSVASAAHIVGTLRATNDNKHPLSSDFQFKRVPGLFCADASVIPVSGNANISLTVIANSIRLADILMNEN